MPAKMWSPSVNTLLKPKRNSLHCHGFMVHAQLLCMRTNVVYFRVMRRLCRREWNWLWNWLREPASMTTKNVITACDIWLQQRKPIEQCLDNLTWIEAVLLFEFYCVTKGIIFPGEDAEQDVFIVLPKKRYFCTTKPILIQEIYPHLFRA